jgi:hypothetical protein
MVLDTDFPMTRTQAKVLIVGLIVMGGFGAALFGGVIPGLKPDYSAPNILILNGERYYFTTVFLPMPIYPVNHTEPLTFPFHAVNFTLWLSNWYAFTGGLVRGNGTEANGTVYSFVLGTSLSPPVNTTQFISPDRQFAVSWPGGPLGGFWVHLMVHV